MSTQTVFRVHRLAREAKDIINHAIYETKNIDDPNIKEEFKRHLLFAWRALLDLEEEFERIGR